MSYIPDSKAQDSGFHKQINRIPKSKFSYVRGHLPQINFRILLNFRIRPGEEIERGYDGCKDKGKVGNPQTGRKAPHLSKYAHAVIFVVMANDPRLKEGKYKNTLQKMREHFREDGKINVFCNL